MHDRRAAGAVLVGCLSLLWSALLACGKDGPPLLGVVEVSVGDDHVCALLDDGLVQCWGDERASQGSGPPGLPVEGLTDVVQIEAGSQHTCARHDDGAVSCWGGDLHGELGGGQPVPDLPAAAELVVGSGKSCVLDADGSLYCWGWGFGLDGMASLAPTRFDVGEPVTSVAPCASHTCALGASGALYCWGDNDQGEYGDDSVAETETPTEIASITGLTAIAQGHQHVCGITDDGGVVCWGPIYDHERTAIAALSGAIELAIGTRHGCARVANGDVYCWGANDVGQLGNGRSRSSTRTAVRVLELGDAVQISTAADVTCAVRADTSVSCWGENGEGRLGDGSTDDSRRPVTVLANP